jgi:hypothetical protein
MCKPCGKLVVGRAVRSELPPLVNGISGVILRATKSFLSGKGKQPCGASSLLLLRTLALRRHVEKNRHLQNSLLRGGTRA